MMRGGNMGLGLEKDEHGVAESVEGWVGLGSSFKASGLHLVAL